MTPKHGLTCLLLMWPVGPLREYLGKVLTKLGGWYRLGNRKDQKIEGERYIGTRVVTKRFEDINCG